MDQIMPAVVDFPPRPAPSASLPARAAPSVSAHERPVHPGRRGTVPPLALAAAVACTRPVWAQRWRSFHDPLTPPPDPPVIEMVVLPSPAPPDEPMAEETPPVETVAQEPPPGTPSRPATIALAEAAPEAAAASIPEPVVPEPVVPGSVVPEPVGPEPELPVPTVMALSDPPPIPPPAPEVPAPPPVPVATPALPPAPPPPAKPRLPPQTAPRPAETRLPAAPPKNVPVRRERPQDIPPPVPRAVARPPVVPIAPFPVAPSPTLPMASVATALPRAAAPASAARPVASPAPPRPPTADQEASLGARVREAVQAAVRYPAAARMMGVTGRARLLLDYRNGTLGGATLVQSSGAAPLDDAALSAARSARYPAPPPELVGHALRLLVWVEFRAG